MTRAWDKEKIWVPDRNWTHDLPNTGRALYSLSYENSWTARSFNWVHMWQVSCILLGWALSRSSWVVIYRKQFYQVMYWSIIIQLNRVCNEKENSDSSLRRLRILQHGPLRWTAHELISANRFFNSLHKINSFLLSRNIFTSMFGGQFQLNVHKSIEKHK